MLKINQVQNIDCKQPKYQVTPSFTAQAPEQQQVRELQAVQPDYNVKVPIKYQKTDELKLPFDYTAHFYKLANGQRVVIIPKEGATVVKTYVNTGSMNEPDNLRGISHYIEHNLFNGSDGLEAGEFFGTVNKMGAETNAATGFAETNYYISSNLLNDTDLEKKIKIHASMLETPRFAVEMLEKEKGIVNSEINMLTGYPENIISNETLKNLYNLKSTSKDLVGGSTQNITNLTRQDVVDYYNNNYFPANMITVITGEVKPDETMQLISKYFSSANKNSHSRKFEEFKPLNQTVRKDIISDKTTATLVMLGFNGPKNNDVESAIYLQAAMKLLTADKTGRIDKNLKDLNTYADMWQEKISSKAADPTAILLGVETTEQNSEKVLKRIFGQIHSLTINPPTDEEMQIVKKALLNSYSHIFDTSSGLNDFIGNNMLDENLRYVTDYEKIVNNMTKDDLVNAAKQFLDLNKTAVTVLHPQQADTTSIKNNYDNTLSFTGNIQKQAINPANVKRYRLDNNFDIVTNNIKTNNAVFQIKYNTEIPKDIKPATLYVLKKILNEGSKFKNDYEYNNELQKNGIIMDFYAGEYSIDAVSLFSADDMEKALKNAKEVLLNPRFTEETLDFAKRDIKEDISKWEKNVNEKLFKELFEGLPLSYTKEDILQSLDSVTLDDVKALYNHILNTSQGHVTVSAPFEKKPELSGILFKEISELPNVQFAKPFLRDTFKTPVDETKVLTDTHEKNQAQIIEAFKFKTNGNLKDTAAIQLLNLILGAGSSSRLFNDLREKQQLAYRVNSSVNYFDNAGLFKIYIGTTTENKETGEQSFDNVQKSINGFNLHIQKIMTEKVTDEELENAKLSLKNMILTDTETAAGKNDSLTAFITDFNGPLADNELLKIIDTITVDDIYNAANYIFSGKPTYSVLATENTLKANEEFFKTL